MIKKIALLAMAVAALVAFAAPSMASAAQWKTSGVLIGGVGAKDAVHLTGTLSSTKGGLKISCTATANVNLWNAGGVGVGEVTSLTLTEDPITVPPTGGCTVAKFTPPPVNAYVDVENCHVQASSTGFNWSVTTAGTTVSILKANFTNEFKGCLAALGIPDGTKIKAEGTVTGVGGGNCITFTEAGDIPETKIDGSLCATSGVLSLS
jgi:hypothetical protein